MTEAAKRVSKFDWAAIGEHLWQHGFSRIGVLLSESECRDIQSMYSDPARFRTKIDMARFRFGKGEYQYFRYPLPEVISRLRKALYANLYEIANAWMSALKTDAKFPATLDEFLEHCREHGQVRPTPLLLRYREGDFNCLHQDVYGEMVFPFQVIVALSEPGAQFKGGELLLVEQIPRAQSRGHALTLARGEAVVISTRFRPIKGNRGFYRATVRHGVSTVLNGERFTLGIVFHDSK
jgi:hypothetical protein